MIRATLRRTAWLLCPLLGACNAHAPHVVPKPPGPPPALLDAAVAPLWVGTGRADLTLPPGGATFGYAPDSRVSNGYWTRLYCRVFYFESAAGQRLALVPCELPNISALLQRHVAARLEKHLHASQIMLTATHTHAGPAHYFGARQFTGVFSSRLPGFDDRVVLELSRRIASATERAIAAKQPAKLSWQHANDFWCMTRNRSLAAFRLNRDPFVVDDKPDCTAGDPGLASIDPAMDVLRIDRMDPNDPSSPRGPIGSISLFAMHPTVLHTNNQMYGGDVLGVVSRFVEEKLRDEPCGPAPCASDADPLHGVINTNEGDIAPVWTTGDVSEAIIVGNRVGEFVWNSHPCGRNRRRVADDEHVDRCVLAEARSVLDSRYVEEEVTNARFTTAGAVHQMCPYGELGEGAARGGGDHVTYVSGLGIFSGESSANYGATHCQSPKIPLLGLVSLMTRGHGSFPTNLPFGVARIGDTLLAFAPAELTVTAGFHVRRQIEREVAGYPGAPQRVVIAGLANEYAEYVATADEYELQAYEGASTLFGPNSAGYMTDRLARLARSLFDRRVVDQLLSQGLTVGVARNVEYGYGPPVDTEVFNRSGLAPRQHLDTCTMPGTSAPPQFCMYWLDGGPADVAIESAPWLQLDLLGTAPPGTDLRAFDDRGLEFQTRAHAKVDGGWVWSTRYSPSLETWKKLQNSRFLIRSNGTSPVTSGVISHAALPHRCAVTQARLCTAGLETEDWSGLLPKAPRRPLQRTRAGTFDPNPLLQGTP